MKAIENDLEDFFSRSVNQSIDPSESFKKKLLAKISGKYPADLIVKFGVDPTRPDIHLGHAVVFRKLRQLQEWGCKAVFLVGDFTATIGDPTGKNKVRPEIEQREIENNMKTFLDQAGKILRTDEKSFSWIRNSDWFTSITDLNLPDDYKVNLQIKQGDKESSIPITPNSFVGKAVVFEKTRMQAGVGLKNKIAVVTLKNFIWGLKNMTHSRLIERDMFQERLKKGQELYMHELIYPVLQGIDSHIISQVYGSCDLEIGGSDQLFNMLVGRDVMKMNKVEPQAVIAFELLIGTDGKEKMSKSLDNYIGINEAPEEIFGKIMSIPDGLLADYFTFCTYTPIEEIKGITADLQNGKDNPRDLKLRLAEEITTIYHGKEKAEESRKNFLNTFQKKMIPNDVLAVAVVSGKALSDVLLENKLIKSKVEFRRLLSTGSIENLSTKEKVANPEFSVSEEAVFKIGKKRFIKVEVIK